MIENNVLKLAFGGKLMSSITKHKEEKSSPLLTN